METALHRSSARVADEIAAFRTTLQHFIQTRCLPELDRWSTQGHPDVAVWIDAGKIGMLLPDVSEEFGGGGGSFAHAAVVIEELARAGICAGFGVHTIVAHYIDAYGTLSQKRNWLPRMARGELVGAIAMTEPDSGSDLQSMRTTAKRDGASYIVNGSKTFITNANQAGLICVAVQTDPERRGPRSLSLLMVETDNLAGFSVGRPLEKVGRHAQNTAELYFNNVVVPEENLLGQIEGRGLFQMLDQLTYERLAVALNAVSVAERAIEITAQYAKDRHIQGKALIEFQNARFKLAECLTTVRVGRVFIDACIEKFILGELDGIEAAMAKYWLTESQFNIIDECVQIHGGYGYMMEYPIARMWADSRVQRIYAGTNEVMKEIIAASL